MRTLFVLVAAAPSTQRATQTKGMRMQQEAENLVVEKDQGGAAIAPRVVSAGALFTAALSLAACGGGGEEAPSPPPPPPPAKPTAQEASRFLGQASMGATTAHIARVQDIGYESWLDEQFAVTRSQSHWDWLVSRGLNAFELRNNQNGIDNTLWRKLIASPDTLRQRIALAWSEILVVSIEGFSGFWKPFQAAAYVDLLEEHALGSFRTLIEKVSVSVTMGNYLTYRGNRKENTATGSQPDENYARELLQLFTIGLYTLNLQGEVQTPGGKPEETYKQEDISGLARVFTGWNWDSADNDTPDRLRRPMIQVAALHELGEKKFLGTTIPAGTDGVQSLKLALDAIVAHPNVAPFIGKQLIQRLVTSNPTPAYVGRVAAVFNSSNGDLKAVVKAILLDDEARNESNLGVANFGKLREPMLRFVAWARAYKATSPSGDWNIPDLSDAGSRLNQSPLRSPSVFNFFRPGYVPPNTGFAQQTLLAPEFQILNESSAVGYINFMQKAVAGRTAGGDLKPDYSELLPIAVDAVKLVASINLTLAANQVGAATAKTISDAVNTIAADTDIGKLDRIYAALTLLMAAPEYIAQK